MARAVEEAPPESDALNGTPHPRMSETFVGHAEAEQTLLSAYRSGKLPHAWVLGGDKGIGKATLAWRFAKFILANPDPTAADVCTAIDLSMSPHSPVVQRVHALGHGDVHVLRREWNEKTKKHFTDIRADDVRGAIHLFQRAASEGGYRIVILDCAEDLNGTSANALLKMIEEPPPRSLFLIISHRPNQILPTIRSRCRKLVLKPLSDGDCEWVLKSLSNSGMTPEIARAAAAARGSVARALKLLSGKSLDIHAKTGRALAQLPKVDWRAIHELADGVMGRAGDDEYQTFMETLQDWLSSRVDVVEASLKMLLPWAEAWTKINDLARETDTYNLDRRALVISLFTELAQAAQNARAA